MYARPAGIENERIWVDGCFDFAHHGHSGAMLQARQLGKELFVGVHSDEDILHNKGPVVMALDERLAAVNACKWLTEAVPHAPYVTDPAFIAKYGCKYVVHGDDITTDAHGEDCYKGVKELGMFVVVRRTPNILTTDLVGRMLLMSKTHHLPALGATGALAQHPLLAADGAMERIRNYASDETGLGRGPGVWVNLGGPAPLENIVEASASVRAKMAQGDIVYVDGGFDLFHPGHIEALRQVRVEAAKTGAAVVVGLHDDKVINEQKGLNYPIMSLFERALCVLQCRYVDALVIGAPYIPSGEFMDKLPGKVVRVFHGATPVAAGVYEDVALLFEQLPQHKYSGINTEVIVQRVLSNKKAYEDRQARKGWKAEVEKRLKAEEAR
ncbi:putative phosphorylethanolamine transferase [Metschnikowia bicuspidata var. bicuspidata NRRL YB-4993]|uniref:ethanolamine-phosphate cytidylyltransferase n=1 Tax=Metschnikowia bicuspidata var. bicuspidata NRRL YB-4993 TaxID=869754 RepID=A0A1A0HF31_9ASCO|nr:putative phosphorylethanolamine transferase [Metschnikowia bicuspidata var. bicuspidata NRRL YB-4993]OBA22739.1 putative phosphorylethanolamine transferase [Metschnikowia bicuspidata var. bicuspidata NRRL YB-4993]